MQILTSGRFHFRSPTLPALPQSAPNRSDLCWLSCDGMTCARPPIIVRPMIGSHPIEGFAIVSADGMIADGDGTMPDCIRNDADQHFLQAAMDRAAVLIHGRHSHEGGPRAAERRRLVVTRQVSDIAPDPSQPNAMLWNPAGAGLEKALATLRIGSGPIAIIGGTQVFDQFLPLYDVFHLTRAERARIPGGRAVFSAVSPTATAADVLIRSGLQPGSPRDIDAAAGITLIHFRRIHP
jgi:dihydrofolate reductase